MSTPSNDQVGIAIVCALENEYNAIELVVDHIWPASSEDNHGQVRGNPNVYTKAKIFNHNVVLVRLPEMGKASAASTAASLRLSFPSLMLLLLVGICGGNPSPESNVEILLGDVIISKSVIQYDLGKRFPDQFQAKETTESSLGRPPKTVRSLVAMLETARVRFQLQQTAANILEEKIQRQASPTEFLRADYSYPGTAQDTLFPADHRHKHQSPNQCDTCASYTQAADPVCAESRVRSCEELGCASESLEWRERLEEKAVLERQGNLVQAQKPKIFFGCVASADTVLKSGEERDALAKKLSQSSGAPILAFEMEGAGVWDELPSIVVKGVCDYADSHKNKKWQNFAAATAAAVARAIIERVPKAQLGTADPDNIADKPQTATVVNGFVFNGPVQGKYFSSGTTIHGGTNTFNYS
jgi:nucleoside phosphorylase